MISRACGNPVPGTLSVSNSLHPDQDWCSVGPDLGTNYLLRFSADDKSCSLPSLQHVLRIGVSNASREPLHSGDFSGFCCCLLTIFLN